MKKNLAKATALLLTAGMIGGTGLTAAASDVELNPAGTYPVVKDGTLEFDCFTQYPGFSGDPDCHRQQRSGDGSGNHQRKLRFHEHSSDRSA